MSQSGVFAELKVGRSLVRYMQSGKIVFSGPKGKTMFAAVMNYMNFIGRGNPMPAMVAVHKLIKDSSFHIYPESRPETELSRLNKELRSATTEHEALQIVAKIHKAQQHAPEIDWDIANNMMQAGEDAGVKR
jgi:hypothetical protein